jgi:carbon storage regulator CsrA
VLVVALKLGESVVIGPDIRVYVTKVTRQHGTGGPVVRIGVDAPKHISIIRSELLEVRDDAADEE